MCGKQISSFLTFKDFVKRSMVISLKFFDVVGFFFMSDTNTCLLTLSHEHNILLKHGTHLISFPKYAFEEIYLLL